jgi:perosamine synthetase
MTTHAEPRRPGDPPTLVSARRPFPPRRLALLGGTTTVGDVGLALRLLVRRGALQDGPAIAAYESAFAARLGMRHAISLSSGRVGLYGLLEALGIGAGDEVLLSVPSHIVVPNAVRYVGAEPVYVDCRPGDWNLDLEAAEARITPRTRALVLQHTFGVPADVVAARALSERRGLVLIEDCVHALGTTLHGRPVGTFGRAAFFSTEETKTISSTMGGVVVTDDDDLADALRAFQRRCAWPSEGLITAYLIKFVVYWLLTEAHVHHVARSVYELLGRRHPLPTPTTPEELRGERPPGYLKRLSNAQAALALQQLLRLDQNLRHRAAISELYRQALQEDGHRTVDVAEGAEVAFVRYPVWVEDRQEATRRAESLTVMGHWFTSVLEEADDPRAVGYVPGSCPHAEAAATHLVNLPNHPRVRGDDARRILDAIRDLVPKVEGASPAGAGRSAGGL